MLEASGFGLNFSGRFLMKTVLVVEDDPINWRVFQKILTRRGGFAAKHTEEVEEVMQIAQSGEADIILMDISLHNSRYQGKAVDGIKITQMLKANPQTAKRCIIDTPITKLPDSQEHLPLSGFPLLCPALLLDNPLRLLAHHNI
jgi:CheY-like chemotaxis protein